MYYLTNDHPQTPFEPFAHTVLDAGPCPGEIPSKDRSTNHDRRQVDVPLRTSLPFFPFRHIHVYVLLGETAMRPVALRYPKA